MDPTIFDEVHRFWFGALDPDRFPGDKIRLWFEGPAAFDAEIRERYADTIDRVDQEGVEIATLSPRQKVGLVILLDQFPRNIHRTSGAAFEHDHEARVAARAVLKHGLLTFHPAEQLFIALPFQHSEDVGDQDLAVFMAAQSAVAAGPGFVDGMRMALDFATKHRDLIRKFGRFPHRNIMIGRETTPDEAAFMKEHGRGY
ncbi:MAG: DUF924 domain-containing protein [Bauldia sp.]|nr:DUF924 domain-containing protein [Bauldia sp.]